jgi:hypothetical protein
MGEAKRRHAKGQRLGEELEKRLRAGEFGPPGARRYLIVLDKSPSGRDALAALRASEGLGELAALFDAEPFRMFEASSLFEYIVLASGEGPPERRSLLAAGSRRLVDEVLPRAWRRQAGTQAAPAAFCGLDEPVREEVQVALRRLGD